MLPFRAGWNIMKEVSSWGFMLRGVFLKAGGFDDFLKRICLGQLQRTV
jgi:hypothetical protein